MKVQMGVMLLGLGILLSGCGNQNSPAVSGQTPTATTAQTQQNIKQVASETVQKAQTLLAQAREYLNQGKFEQAITVAQNVLSFDPQNLDAKKIIEMAQAKIKALAEQKAGELKTGLMNNLGTLGK